MNRCAINDRINSFRQMAPLPGNECKILINLVNFDLVNADFSFNLLKFNHIDHTLSDPK